MAKRFFHPGDIKTIQIYNFTHTFFIQIHKTKGAITGARAQIIREGEKNSKFFLSVEKSRGNNNTILQVKNEQDDSV